jgi:hypothetical protein
MNLSEIREECWDIAREVAVDDEDRLWTTAEMNRYINRIYRHIARETKCIRDALGTLPTSLGGGVSPITRIVSTPTTDHEYYSITTSWLYGKTVAPILYALDKRIIDIDEVKWTTRQWRLTKVSVNKWQVNPWWEQVPGMPTEYCTDYQNNYIAINFRSEETDTLRLCVRRMPLANLVKDDDEPEFRDSYHDYFVNGVLWQMYSKQDAQAFDLKKSDAYYASFLLDVDEIKQQETILDQRLKANHSLDAFR